MEKQICDLCKCKDSLLNYYRPIKSQRGAEVFICKSCLLIQTKYNLYSCQKSSIRKTISTDANWGNIRHGKGIRFADAKLYLDPILDEYNPNNILDIGSNRGDFIKYISKKNYVKFICGIEPDKNLKNEYINLLNNSKIKIIWDKFENINTLKKYDFIYSCQTLEHALSADEMIKKSYQLLNNNGLMYIEVPEVNIIQDQRGIEEYFIDKHSFHFSLNSLINLANKNGFEVLKDFNSDKYNVKLLFKKGLKKDNTPKDDLNSMLIKIDEYKKIIPRNRKILREIVRTKLSPLAKKQKVAYWGANRIFDSLVKYGNLSLDDVFMLVDNYMHGKLDSSNGFKIEHPDYLRIKEPNVCVILARSSEEYLAKVAYEMGIRHILKYSEIFDQIHL